MPVESTTIPPRSCRLPRLRHHPARRRPARGGQLLRRRQARRRPADGRDRGRVHRGRLAGRPAQGHRVLRPGPHGAQAPARASWSPSAPPARPASASRTTSRCARCWTPRRRSSAWSPSPTCGTCGRRCARRWRRTSRWSPTRWPSSSAHGRRVFLDCEHFFDGYAHDRDYGVRVLEAAFAAGAEVGVMCDTNGGMLPMGVGRVVADVPGPHRRQARHPLPGRHRLRRRQLPRRRRGRRHARAGHRQRLRRAGRQRRHRSR